MGESLTLRPTGKSSSSAKALNPGINMEMQQKNGKGKTCKQRKLNNDNINNINDYNIIQIYIR